MKYKYSYKAKKNSTDKKKIIILISTIFITLLISLFLFRNNPVVAKINNVLTAPFKFVSDLGFVKKIKDGFQTNSELKIQLENLQKENSDMALKLIEYEKLSKENESLRNQLGIKENYKQYKLVTANIIIRSHDSYNRYFEISAGSLSKVEIGQAVIHKEGLVGYISSVSENTSIVTTILDPKTSVSAKMQTLSTPCMLTGTMEMKDENNLKLESIEIGKEISVGDIIYTSGLGNMYPAYIPVAKIDKVINKKTETGRYAICTPLVDISRINEIAVIIGDN